MAIEKYTNKNYVFSLQLLRIVAAFFVMLFHINSIFETKYGVYSFLSYVNFGQSGVHVFFVLSGYVMYLMHRNDIGQGIEWAKTFAIKRFIRIYPTYWILSSCVLALMFFTSGEVKAYKYSPSYIFESYSLVRLGFMDGNPLIPAGWTLFHEVKFYAFFWLLIIVKNARTRNAIIFATLFLTVVNIFIDTSEQPVFTFYFSSFNLLFAMGVLSGWVTDRYAYQLGNKTFVAIAIAAFAGVSLISNLSLWGTNPASIIAFGIVSFFIVTLLSCYERTVEQLPLSKSTVLFLANITYCLYLIHYPVYTVVTIAAQKLNFNLPYALLIGMMIISSVVISIVFYKWIEEPLIEILKRNFLVTKKREKPPAVASE